MSNSKLICDMYGDVLEFFKKFDLLQHCTSHPGWPKAEITEFRLRFLLEELCEFDHAAALGDTAAAFDALIDIVYVALGTAIFMNLPWQVGWDRVQAANMQKIRAARSTDSKRGTAFDVVKPPSWQAPTLDDLIDGGGRSG